MAPNRRKFLSAAAVGGTVAAAAAFPAPAIAVGALPEVRWRCASSFPKSLDAIFGGGEETARRVAAATDGKFQIRVFAGGEIVPGLQVLDAVQAGTVECGHSSSFYYVGKDPTFAFDTAVPFGLNARQQNAWMTHGGGLALMREFFAGYGVVQFPCGNTGAQMGGWFRKEINGLEDMVGLKMRIGGLAGKVMAKLGMVPQQIAGSDVYEALERGTIDAVEWSGPFDDLKLGFHRVARHYYAPGWWEGGAQITMMVGKDAYEALPPVYKTVLESACAAADASMLARYDVLNAQALKTLAAEGALLRAFPRATLLAAYEAAEDVMGDEAARNPRFAKVYREWSRFRDESRLWFRVAEFSYDAAVYAMSGARR
jgi:TRAP-type mannitol/chloroaromatic compound transport system substrate-binding protein